ncbi:MAG TPA: hypothetical protein QF564_15175 [Pirellulaceae bacterium]|nr:hypothetical protein [Pirellulaceae bacterium]
MAGPWFTVQESGEQWKEISKIWISNGNNDCKGRIEMRIRLTAKTALGTLVDHRDLPGLHDKQGAMN